MRSADVACPLLPTALEDVDIMRIASCMCIGAVLVALTPSIVSAQERRVHVNFGGGPTFNAGDLGDHFANGWGPAIGVTNHQTHQLAFNLVANLKPPGSAVRPYFVGGPGTYYRKVEITEYIGNGVVCDPWYYVCGTYPIEDVIGSRGGWDFGFNLGGGVGFGLGESSEFFVEMRYHHVYGPDISSATPLPASVEGTSTGGSTNGSYYPLTFGFRF
jgi:hypothetical protein